MKSPNGMMLWTDLYLSDTGHLSTKEHGAYLLILMAMWRNGGTLPDDDTRLARTCRTTLPSWRKIAPNVRALLVDNGDGTLSQKRLSIELGKALCRIRKNTTAGIKGNEAKSLKKQELAHANGNATRTLLNLNLQKERKIQNLKSVNSHSPMSIHDIESPDGKFLITADEIQHWQADMPLINVKNQIKSALKFFIEGGKIKTEREFRSALGPWLAKREQTARENQAARLRQEAIDANVRTPQSRRISEVMP
jgi:uncharacterized protein YdaU (DUF1376 family)